MQKTSSLTQLAIGCIGCGAMGSAILKGLPQNTYTLYGYNRTAAKVEALKPHNVIVTSSSLELTKQSNIVLLAVKPYQINDVLKDIASALTPETTLVSLAAGISLTAIQEAINHKCAVVRCMPNTPAQIGLGIFGLVLDDPKLTHIQKEQLQELFAHLGKVVVIAESIMHEFSALFGAGPAYVFYFIEALAEVSTSLGFTRQQSIELATQLFVGSAKLVEESKQHPSLLREAVCSPGGLTIAGVMELDRGAVRAKIMDAVLASLKKSKSM